MWNIEDTYQPYTKTYTETSLQTFLVIPGPQITVGDR